MRRPILLKSIVPVLLICCSCFSQQLSKRMTNQDVIDMVSLGFSDGVIIEKLRTVNVTDFDTSLPGLRVLKAAKVSDAVIRIMINPALASTNTAGAAKTRYS